MYGFKGLITYEKVTLWYQGGNSTTFSVHEHNDDYVSQTTQVLEGKERRLTGSDPTPNWAYIVVALGSNLYVLYFILLNFPTWL